MEPIWAVGLMTGTVLDGYIDLALLRTDGETITEFGAYELVPYPDETKRLLEKTLAEARAWAFDGPEPEIFSEAETAISRAQAAAVRRVAEVGGLTMADIGIVGFHGQTVLHRAPTPGRIGATRQLGDGRLMARILGTDVAYDFRSADIAAGGQGAPLSAIYHKALMATAGNQESTAVLNLGGVANVTWVSAKGEIAAFDTGPANAPLNDFVKSMGAGEMDRDGTFAFAGTVDKDRLAKRLTIPYLSQPYPKSLDRFDFGFDWVEGLSLEDGAATLTAFSAAAVGAGLDILPSRPTRLVVCGGGRWNPAMMKMLNIYARVEAVAAEDYGWRADAVEAECFALLAVRTLRGLPISLPTTTGVKAPLCGGRIARSNQSKGPTLTITDAPVDHDQAIHGKLSAFNAAFVGEPNRSELQVTLHEPDGSLVAGAFGFTIWNYLYIQWLWVAEGYRRQGMANRLIAAAENRALERGCTGAWIDTFSQAGLGAYRKAGYEVFGELPNFAAGQARIFLRKSLEMINKG
ncbi:anhydro-N-acetylmuramic acid kinase [Pelagibius sp. Alg239-R121]|uniref:anhydro-N-acetylmuramic acid kinase n=1 Tax=Pelagibius sp. Alg239-R121 TaxID=2993448 RepID=UPI002AC35F16|nr:anhydro-N-acetylmuramic acid kinase [Pelagibius sp. Alg239-R121]